ncbi:restriction endonuclease subunit S [Salmonella enterica]|nr:restriction endonuclease subunit S [Salmonella enterica]EBW7943851.1 restriction endonuclease subunit S [Salmonella enterica subsp. enterica serovar Newport]EAT1612361.1 restriction endonuclease subunit S [Salmonella enterica]EBA9172780.1 restriction endonuclease subunit S [Salmonella enterica]EBI5377351.1 restriction endonuclease subunit S [Salmonella enterica]
MTWPMKPLSELCELAIDCVNKTAPVVEGPTSYKMIRTTNVKGGFIDIEHVRYVTEETFEKWTRRSRPKYGDVVLTREAPVGEVGRCTFDESQNIFLGQRLFLYRPDSKLLDWNYLAYALQSPIVQNKLHGMSFGATVPHVKVGDAENLEIPYPELKVQKYIGKTLAAYDDLIENNRRRIALLEESIRLIYQEWFVNLRFPNAHQCHKKAGIPMGWLRKPLSEVVEFNPKVNYEKNVLYPFVPMQALSESSMVIRTLEERIISGGAKFQNKDTLFARITPCLENGKTGFVQFLDEEKNVASGSTEFIVMRSKTLTPYFVYCLARNEEFRKHAIGSMVGSDGRQRVNVNCFDAYFVLQPSEDILERFDKIAEPIFDEIKSISNMNQRLYEARNALIPKLMSGEIQI